MEFYELVAHDLPAAVRFRGDLGILLQWEFYVALIGAIVFVNAISWPFTKLWNKEISYDENKGWNDPKFFAMMYLAIGIGVLILAIVLVDGVTVE